MVDRRGFLALSTAAIFGCGPVHQRDAGASTTIYEDALWVTEVWDSEASHQASLSLPSVREAVRAGRPLIAGFEERFVTTPLGGHGLDRTR